MNKEKKKGPFEDHEYMGNIFGKKHTLYALIIILLFLGIAVCRYLVIQPERLIIDPEDPVGMVDEMTDERIIGMIENYTFPMELHVKSTYQHINKSTNPILI